MSLLDLMKYRDSGELSDVTIVVEGEELKLHKFPLYIKSDYFKEVAAESGKEQVELEEFPGGAACFKVIADFCYNKKIDISLENVAQLRCGAEYLKMAGDNNLIDLTERYLDDIIRSAQMSRSLSPIPYRLSRTAAEEAKIAERCFAAVMDVWTKPGRVDALVVDRLLRLPLDWFERLAKSCGSEGGERQLRPLAELATRYLHRVFQRDTDLQKQQQQQKKPEKKKEQEKSAEKEKDDDDAGEEAAEEPQQEQQEAREEQQAGGGWRGIRCRGRWRRQEEASSSSSSSSSSKMSPRSQPARSSTASSAACAEPTPSATEVISGTGSDWPWLASEQYSCQCRPRLLQLAGNMLHRRELKQMPSPVLCDIVSSTAAAMGGDAGASGEAQVLSGVIDNHLLDLARAGSLTAEEFAKLATSVPADYRASHDTLYEAAETLLTAGESIPDDQQKAVVEAVDLSRCEVSTLQRALDKGAFPAKVVCQAAIDLAQRQQSLQVDGKFARREDFKPTFSSSPSRRYGRNVASPSYDGIGAGYSSYREPIYGSKFDSDFEASSGLRYSALGGYSDSAAYPDTDRAPGWTSSTAEPAAVATRPENGDQCPAGRPPIKTAEEN
uniref:BTB domain-containing protein n=1 Tax=Macrostomum lignano TaxID=282301 RepID=A0A1I8HIE9_9PLAT